MGLWEIIWIRYQAHDSSGIEYYFIYFFPHDTLYSKRNKELRITNLEIPMLGKIWVANVLTPRINPTRSLVTQEENYDGQATEIQQ